MFFFSSRRRHTRCLSDWSSDVCSSDLGLPARLPARRRCHDRVLHLLWHREGGDRKSTRLNSSHLGISYAVFCLKKKNILSLSLRALPHPLIVECTVSAFLASPTIELCP